MRTIYIIVTVLVVFELLQGQKAKACRVGSEKLKVYTKKTIERLLDKGALEKFYWDREPLDARTFARITGINVTLAETRFNLSDTSNSQSGNVSLSTETFIKDTFVTCSADRDRSYTLTINLEVANPFKMVDLHYRYHEPPNNTQEVGLFRINLPQSAFLIQLNQRIKYDECLNVKYVQLSPSVAYEVQCVSCSESQEEYLDKVFSKRMTQFDSEMDSMLSEKLLLGIQTLLSQQRLDLDLYLE